jgi:NitT/TauT family transport system substrate-binding protein
MSALKLATRRSLLRCTAAAVAIMVSGVANETTASAQDLTKIRITVDYRLYGANAPMWYAQASGLFKEAGIDAIVDGSSGSGEAITRVASGAYDVAYADIGTLAEFWTHNPSKAPKLVMVVLDRSAQSIVSLKKANITKMSDLVGHKIGTGQADATARLFPAVLKINNVPIDKLQILPLEQRLRDAMLLRGDVDAVIGFDSAILFNLAGQNVGLNDTNVLYYADNGFNFYGNGLLVSRDLIEKNPDLVKRLASAVAKAWIASIKNPKATIDALTKRDSMANGQLEMRRLQWILDRNVITADTRKEGIGYLNPEKMDRGLKTLASGFGFKTTPTVTDLYDQRFLPPLSERILPSK